MIQIPELLLKIFFSMLPGFLFTGLCLNREILTAGREPFPVPQLSSGIHLCYNVPRRRTVCKIHSEMRHSIMKILILSCNTGEGHNSAGKALAEYARLQGDEAEFMDIMMLGGKRVSHFVGGGYVSVVKHAPALFSLLYKIGGLVSSSRHKSPVYYANALLAGRLKRCLDGNDFDVIVTPHLFPAETLTYMKRKKMLRQKVVAVETDYTCIPFWEETECDYYILPHPSLIGEFAGKGIPEEKLKPFGIPVRPAFSKPGKKAEARKICRIPEDASVYLIMSGSMGFGKVNLFVARLLRRLGPNEYIIVICGSNQKLRKVLHTAFGRHPQVRILGYTEHISAYMDACDVIFTKPGGLTSTEAAVKGIPIVHTRPIPGCETKNLEFFTERGLSVTAPKMGGQIDAGQALLHDRARREEMCAKQRQVIPRNAAAEIWRLLRELSEE